MSVECNGTHSNDPTVISHLSSGDYAVDEENFQSTMKYIFTFIEKVRWTFPSVRGQVPIYA